MRKIFFIILVFFTNITLIFANLQEQMLPTSSTVLWTTNTWKWALNWVIVYFKNFIFWFLWLLVIWMFIYFWFKLISANWSPEDLKKALMWFVYIAVWLGIMSLAWAAVKLVTTLNF